MSYQSSLSQILFLLPVISVGWPMRNLILEHGYCTSLHIYQDIEQQNPSDTFIYCFQFLRSKDIIQVRSAYVREILRAVTYVSSFLGVTSVHALTTRVSRILTPTVMLVSIVYFNHTLLYPYGLMILNIHQICYAFNNIITAIIDF